MYAALRPEDFSDGSATAGGYKVSERTSPSRQLDTVTPSTAPSPRPFRRRRGDGALSRAPACLSLPLAAGPSFFSPTYLGNIHPAPVSALESQHGVVGRAVPYPQRRRSARGARRPDVGEVFAGFVCGFFLSPSRRRSSLRPCCECGHQSCPGEHAAGRRQRRSVTWCSIRAVLLLDRPWHRPRPRPAGDGGRAAAPPARLNAPYTLFVFSIVLAICAPLALLIAPWRRQIAAAAVATFLIFGWLMPYMAEWSKFD